jgi:ergothioneine biosynthesis protein EgtB
MKLAGVDAGVDSPQVLAAGRGLLALALMDARNHTLHLLGSFENALGAGMRVGEEPGVLPPSWIAGHVAWLAEYWIARNPQRALGPACPAEPVRLASVEPAADGWFNPALIARDERFAVELPALVSLKAYLLDTLETTLELLDKTPEDDPALHFFRMALWHEDWRGEQLIALAQTLAVPIGLRLPEGGASREPIALPATQWRLGREGAGFAPAIERGDSPERVPEFEIDAQPVSWAQYVEFIDDGGYDRPEFWRPEGWQWLERQAQDEGRRGPRHVEQIGVASGAVMQNLFGKPARMGGTQNAMHVSWWEADAYARWAQRRLPTEIEWEIAVDAAARRGLRWGEVWEWTAGTLQPLPGYSPDAWARDAELDPRPMFGKARVLRGASFATRARMKQPQARAWALPGRDDLFVGFRTCAV